MGIKAKVDIDGKGLVFMSERKFMVPLLKFRVLNLLHPLLRVNETLLNRT